MEWREPNCVPKSLYCGHSFCDNCLIRIYLKCKVILCPTCNNEHKLPPEIADSDDPKTIVASLPKNFSLIALLNEQSGNTSPINDNIEFVLAQTKGICLKHNLPLHSYVVEKKMPLCDKCINELRKGTKIEIIPSVFIYLN